ncbi:MAG: NAD(P)/FAD-dependent oxidoreductase [Micrococcaceae bacterium]
MWEVAIIGGGAAGLSAALTLARARRSVVVIDGGAPRNAPADAAHGLIGREGINPMELLTTARAEATAVGAQILHTEVVEVSGSGEAAFTLRLADGTEVRAGQLLIATGVRDELPELPGLAQRWGRDVVHCPYCHGWEIRDQRIGVLAIGPMSAMQTMMFRQWSEQVWFFTQGKEFPAEQLAQLDGLGVRRVAERVRGLEVREDRLHGVRLSDGTLQELDALVVPALTRARLEGLEGLGLQTAESPMGTGLVADASGHCSVPGVWAAGNVVNAGQQVSEAAANGARVAMTLNTELVFAQAARLAGAATSA